MAEGIGRSEGGAGQTTEGIGEREHPVETTGSRAVAVEAGVKGALPEEIRRSEFSNDDRELGRPELTPLGECRGALELEIVP